MNNGNLLNSLLGITSANPGVTKSTAAKARAESTEKFHQALEQVRPEIAARKPAARKETPVAESANAARPAPKPLARQDAQEKVERSAAQPKTLKDDQRVIAKAESVDHSVDDKHAHEPLEGRSSGEQSAELQDQSLEAAELSAEGQGLVVLEDPAIAHEDPVVALDDSVPTPVTTDEVDTEIESSVSVLSPTPIQPLVMEESANEDDIDVSLAPEKVLVVDPALMPTDKPSQPVATEADLAVDGDESLLAGIPSTTGQLVASGVTAAAAVDVPSPAVQAATGMLVGQAVLPDGEVSDAEADLLVDADAETSMNTDGGENPDFLLLNSKAALNKLAESTLVAAAQDKAAPAIDVKPAVISATAEAVTRLAEAAQSPAARAFVVQTGVPVTVGSPQWSQAVGDKVLWLAAQNVSAAEIRLDPPELGPMQVKVSVNQDQASVTFSSPHPAVREALDQQLNRLREMFTEQGLNLVNVDVSDKSFTKREQEESAKHQRGGGEDDEDLAPVAVSQTISMRLVDHYA